MASPYVTLPTEWLRLSVELVSMEQQQQSAVIGSQSLSSAPVKNPVIAPQGLDSESEKRIKQYIATHNKHGAVIWPAAKTKAQQRSEVSADGQFYLPDMEQSDGGKGWSVKELASGLLSTARNYVAPPDPPLTLDVLVANRVSLYALLTECRVSVTNLHAAGILRSFDDLLALKFKVKDLVRKRELFDAGKLPMLFNVTFQSMRQQGCLFRLRDLHECGFFPGELETLGVSLDTMICEDHVTADQLIELNWSLDDLQRLGFGVEHLDQLKITQKLALAPFPVGFGWSREEYRDLCEG